MYLQSSKGERQLCLPAPAPPLVAPVIVDYIKVAPVMDEAPMAEIAKRLIELARDANKK